MPSTWMNRTSERVLENLTRLRNLGYAARAATAKPQVFFLLSTLAHVQSFKLHLGTTAVCLSEFIPLTAVNPCDSAVVWAQASVNAVNGSVHEGWKSQLSRSTVKHSVRVNNFWTSPASQAASLLRHNLRRLWWSPTVAQLQIMGFFMIFQKRPRLVIWPPNTEIESARDGKISSATTMSFDSYSVIQHLLSCQSSVPSVPWWFSKHGEVERWSRTRWTGAPRPKLALTQTRQPFGFPLPIICWELSMGQNCVTLQNRW